MEEDALNTTELAICTIVEELGRWKESTAREVIAEMKSAETAIPIPPRAIPNEAQHVNDISTV